jgi:hypothetical protein
LVVVAGTILVVVAGAVKKKQHAKRDAGIANNGVWNEERN